MIAIKKDRVAARPRSTSLARDFAEHLKHSQSSATSKAPIRVSIERMAQIYRVMEGENLLPGDREAVTIADLEPFTYIRGFVYFLRLNARKIQLFEESV